MAAGSEGLWKQLKNLTASLLKCLKACEKWTLLKLKSRRTFLLLCLLMKLNMLTTLLQ